MTTRAEAARASRGQKVRSVTGTLGPWERETWATLRRATLRN